MCAHACAEEILKSYYFHKLWAQASNLYPETVSINETSSCGDPPPLCLSSFLKCDILSLRFYKVLLFYFCRAKLTQSCSLPNLCAIPGSQRHCDSLSTCADSLHRHWGCFSECTHPVSGTACLQNWEQPPWNPLKFKFPWIYYKKYTHHFDLLHCQTHSDCSEFFLNRSANDVRLFLSYWFFTCFKFFAELLHDV